MMENDTSVVDDEKLLFGIANGSVCKTSVLKDVMTQENVTDINLIPPQCFLPENNIPNIELPEPDAYIKNENFVNNCIAGHATDDILTAIDEGFNEERVLPSESSDDAAGTDKSSICSTVDLTPNSAEERHTKVVELQNNVNKIPCKEITEISCSYAENKSLLSSRKLCDTPVNDALTPSRHGNVFELEFLQGFEKLDSSFSCDDAKTSSAASGAASESVTLSTASSSGTEYISDSVAMKVSVQSLMSDQEVILNSGLVDVTSVASTVVGENESNDAVKRSGVPFPNGLRDDAKLWCETYVKLVDCANLLLLTIPSVITDTLLEGKFPITPKTESVSEDKSISRSRHSKDLGAVSTLERIGKPHTSDGSSFCDDNNSHSDRGRKKRQRRSRKAPENKAPKSQSRSPRRIVFSSCKASKKRSHGGDPDEVICKLDAWKKLHKSQAKANKEVSLNALTSCAAHLVTVKQEPLDDFGGLSTSNENQFTADVVDSWHAQIKTELVSDADVFTALHSGDQISQLPSVEPKKELADSGFAIIKQEPADDYLYMDNCNASELDTTSVTPLFPIDNVVSLAPAHVEVSGAYYDMSQILQDKHLQPSVILKRFPIWILQKLQRSAAGLSVDSSPVSPPQIEEVSGYWASSSITQGPLQNDYEAVPFNVTRVTEADLLTAQLNQNSVPQYKEVLMNSENESSWKFEVLPSEDVAQTVTTCLESSSASKIYASKTGKVRECKKKREKVRNRSMLSESVCSVVDEVSAEQINTETPKRALRSQKNIKVKLQIPKESKKPPERKDAGSIPDNDKPEDTLLVEPPVIMRKIPKVSAGEKKHENDHREKTSKVECVEDVHKSDPPHKRTRASKDLVQKVPSVADTKRSQKSKGDEKVLLVKRKVPAVQEKNSKPKLGFVIPKKKPPDLNALFSSASQHKTELNLAPLTSTFSRIPKVPKTLSAEDKERSVLAKLDKDNGKRETLKWDSCNGWTSQNSATLGSNLADCRGVGSQDKQQEEKWQRTGVDGCRLQYLNGPERHPLVPYRQQLAKVPLLGDGPGISAVSSEWNRTSNATNHESMSSISLDVGQPQNSTTWSFSSQPNQRMDEQWPIPTVGYNIPVIQSVDRWKSNRAEVQSAKLNCTNERETSLTEPAMLDRTLPVLREVPYVSNEPDEVFSCSYGNDDDDYDDDNSRGTDKLQSGKPYEVLASSSPAVSQSFSLLEDPPMADNMDDSIRLFAEAVQEAIEQGNISPEKCDRLLHLYEKLCRDLNAEDVTESQQNAETAGIICDTIQRTMFKDLRLIDDLAKNRQTSTSFGAASDLLRNFGDADKWSPRGNSIDYVRPNKTDQKHSLGGNETALKHRRSALYGDRKSRSSASGIYRQELQTGRASGSTSFDDWNDRSFAILEDDALWRDLLAQAKSPGMSEESLEILRRLLLEAAKGGVYDEQMVSMLNALCQHIRLEDSKEQSLRKNFAISSTFQPSARSENVEIPFLTEEQHFMEIKGTSKIFQQQDDEPFAPPVSSRSSSKLQTGSYEVHGMSDVESEAAIEAKFAPDDDTSVAERLEQVKRKQEAFMTKVSDELQLLEMFVAIQCELAAVSCSEYLPLATSLLYAGPEAQSTEAIQLTEPDKLAELSLPHMPPSEPSKAVELSIISTQPPALESPPFQPAVEKTSSESCNTPSVASEPSTHPCSTSTAGDESQDSFKAQKAAKEKDNDADKTSCDPKAIEDKVISLARNALKPHYHNGAITSEEFKLIMKKAIAKICKSRSKDISQKRITKFMNAYVEKVIQSRK